MNSASQSSKRLSPENIFGDLVLGWGKEHAHKKIVDVWYEKQEYLLWAANLSKNKCSSPPGRAIVELIRIAHLAESGEQEQAQEYFEKHRRWQALSEEGRGLEDLPRPSREDCLRIIQQCTILGGHHDLDGIYSLAAAIARGGALEYGKRKGAFSRLRLFRYGFRNIQDYTQALAADPDDIIVIIDYAAHPQASLTLDHHVTSLSYWEPGTDIPCGVFAPSMPSCPRLLATFCGLQIEEEILTGCDMIDGALYTSVEQAADLANPFVALELALSLDVSEVVAKKVILTLAEHNLDPFSVLHQPVWKTRVELLRHELEEQRSFWSRRERIRYPNEFVAIADSRLAPYSASRFRYLPLEIPDAMARPYIVTIRPSGGSRINLGIARNPFFSKPEFFNAHPLNLGALARTIGKGGGRQEVGSSTIEMHQLAASIDRVLTEVQASLEKTP